jgi:hypothetical protein
MIFEEKISETLESSDNFLATEKVKKVFRKRIRGVYEG